MKQNLVFIIGAVLMSISYPLEAAEPIEPIPLQVAFDKAKANIGNKLFHDNRLSKDETISCATCHPLSQCGVDGLQVSVGISGQLGDFNAPTVYNSVYNIAQFWDGRAETLEEQAAAPSEHPKEMGTNWKDIVVKIQNDPEYVKLFKEAYPKQGITKDTITNAIAEFERTLITPNSRFDKYLRGDKSAISAEELKGYELFKSYGCVICHSGINVGGKIFQKMGIFKNYFEDRGNITIADYGRYNFTQKEADRFRFKVPGLRNVAVTAPYFHDGSVKNLSEAVNIMAEYQLGKTLTPEETTAIVAFLKTLTGVLCIPKQLQD